MSSGCDSPTVLAVDDLRDYRDLYRTRLGDDYDVRTAADGDAALDAVGDDVDVVLLDRDLPGLTGDEVLSRIRSAGYDCRVALVAADDPDEDVLDLGYDASLTKPVSGDELVDVVDRLVAVAAYVEAVEEYHAACERRATESDAAAEGAVVDDNLAAMRERVDELAADFDADDYRVVFRDLDQRP